MAMLRGIVSKNKFLSCCEGLFIGLSYIPAAASLLAALLYRRCESCECILQDISKALMLHSAVPEHLSAW